MPETKKYCTPLPDGLLGVPDPNDTSPAEIESKDLLDNVLEAVDSVVDLSEGPTTQDLDGPEFEDGPEVPGWEDRSKDDGVEMDKLYPENCGPDSDHPDSCETNPKSIGCKVLGDQFIYAIQGLITDLESTKPPGYILAVGKLKGAIIKLQAGN